MRHSTSTSPTPECACTLSRNIMQQHQQAGSPREPRQAPVAPTQAPAPQQVAPVSAQSEESFEDDEANLEFRPVVKYAGIAVLLALLVGVEYATYEGGYSRGYRDAAHSGEVEASINEAAVANLRHFMQVASADDDTLLSTIANRGDELAWIREPSVRREAEWLLAQSALDRGRGGDITDLLAELFRDAPGTEVWARRALAAARSLAATADAPSALEVYRTAIARFAALGNADTRLVAMNELASLLATTADENTLSALDALQGEVSGLGEAGRLLRADILAYMGRLYRERGDQQAAMRCFEEALAGVKADEVPALAGASVCYGLALLEKGDTERAETLLREGVSRLGDTPADASYLISALRALARLEQERGAADAALAHLYRAEGAATNRVPAQNHFWGCLYDQRGWVNLLKGAHEAALADFRRAINLPAAEDVLLQSCEGAGRCCIIMGDAEQAVNYLSKAAELRERLMVHEGFALGRVYLLLAQAQDMRGDNAAAADAYGKSLKLLASATEKDDVENRLSAHMGQAYALGQLGQWAEAAVLWEQALPLVAGDAPRETEVRHQLALCRRHGDANAAPEESDEEDAEAEEAPKPKPTPRRRSRSRRR